ncbi:MAG: hypothetical protein ACK5MA_03005 [Parachlamydiaceae bacterium]
MRIRQIDAKESMFGLQAVIATSLLVVVANSCLSINMSLYAAGIGNRVSLIYRVIAEKQLTLRLAPIVCLTGISTMLLVEKLDPKIQRICFIAIIVFDLCVVAARCIELRENLERGLR